MSDHELHHGDMLEVMPTLAQGSVSMVFADLPYGILSHRNWDTKIDLNRFWSNCRAICSQHAVSVLTANIRFAAELVISNSRDLRYDLVWQKSYASNFLLAKKRPLCQHENVLVFADKKHTYNPQMRPENERLRDSKTPLKSTPTSKWHSARFKTRVTVFGPMYPKSVLPTSENRRGKIHPTQKPVALLEWLIATYTNPGDTVLDPCFGSNTTGVACARLGRKYIGIEKDAEYFRIGKERLEREVEALRTGPSQTSLAV